MPKFPLNFGEIEQDPDFQSLSPAKQGLIRTRWVNQMLSLSGNPNDEETRAKYEEMAFRTAPGWARPKPVGRESAFHAEHPYISAALPAAERVLRTPQQFVAELLGQLGEKKTLGRAFTDPFTRSGQYYMGLREARELPGGVITQEFTDPLNYLGVGLIPAVRSGIKKIGMKGAGVMVPAEMKMVPKLTEKMARKETAEALSRPQTIMGEIREVIPRKPSEYLNVQTLIHNKVMKNPAIQQFFTPGDLRTLAETVANLPPKDAVKALRRLDLIKTQHDANYIMTWARAPIWRRRARWWDPVEQAAKKVTEPGTVGGGIDINSPGAVQKAIEEELMKPVGMP